MEDDSEAPGPRGFIRSSDKDLFALSENELIREILQGSQRLYEFFGFAMTDVHDLKSEEGWNYIFLGNIDRVEFGLSREGQPGDIDLLIIPHRNDQLHVGKAAAIEIKRLSLRHPRWDRSSDRYGVTQANGLIDAGFPYVGILHLVVHERGPSENHREMMSFRVLDNEGRAALEKLATVDTTGFIACERQLGRLLAQAPNPVIGLNCVSITEIIHQGHPSLMVGAPHGRTAKRNPRASAQCASLIGRYMYKMRDNVVRGG